MSSPAVLLTQQTHQLKRGGKCLLLWRLYYPQSLMTASTPGHALAA